MLIGEGLFIERGRESGRNEDWEIVSKTLPKIRLRVSFMYLSYNPLQTQPVPLRPVTYVLWLPNLILKKFFFKKNLPPPYSALEKTPHFEILRQLEIFKF